MKCDELSAGFKVEAGRDRFGEVVTLGGEPNHCKLSSRDTGGAMWLLLAVALVLMLQLPASAESADEQAQTVFDAFVAEYTALRLPGFEMSYVSNFQKIPPPDEISRRAEFFERMRRRLRAIVRGGLSDEVRYQYDALRYEIDFQLQRAELERKFRQRDPFAISNRGLSSLPDGHDWYRLYIKRWGSKNLTPQLLLALGEAEVARVSGEIRVLQSQLGYAGRASEFHEKLNSAEFTVQSEAEVKQQFLRVRDTVHKHLSADFSATNIPLVDVQPVAGPTKDTPPGYYDKGVFYYTFFNGRFPRRAREWLFLHEAVPGHHYQVSTGKSRPPIRALFWYPGFSEGWGAYAEDLGKDVGCFDDPYEYLGKWEWDLVRSARVVLDVRIHNDGWTRDQALAWWHAHVPNQDGIAEREVDRIIRWPAQVISYKVGERTILDLRAMAQKRAGAGFDLRRFHALVLERGSIPLSVLEEVVADAVQTGALTKK